MMILLNNDIKKKMLFYYCREYLTNGIYKHLHPLPISVLHARYELLADEVITHYTRNMMMAVLVMT